MKNKIVLITTIILGLSVPLTHAQETVTINTNNDGTATVAITTSNLTAVAQMGDAQAHGVTPSAYAAAGYQMLVRQQASQVRQIMQTATYNQLVESGVNFGFTNAPTPRQIRSAVIQYFQADLGTITNLTQAAVIRAKYASILTNTP